MFVLMPAQVLVLVLVLESQVLDNNTVIQNSLFTIIQKSYNA